MPQLTLWITRTVHLGGMGGFHPRESNRSEVAWSTPALSRLLRMLVQYDLYPTVQKNVTSLSCSTQQRKNLGCATQDIPRHHYIANDGVSGSVREPREADKPIVRCDSIVSWVRISYIDIID